MKWIFILHLLLTCMRVSDGASSCPPQCGELSIPYPFSLEGHGCGLPDLSLICDPQIASTPMLLIESGTYQLLHFNRNSLLLSNSHIRASANCSHASRTAVFALAKNAPFALTNGNVFFTTGCNTTGTFASDTNAQRTTCSVGNCTTAPASESCSGKPCCTAHIQQGTRYIHLDAVGPAATGSCGFSSISFSYSSAGNTTETGELLGPLVEWAIPRGRCVEAINSTNYECVDDAICEDGDAVNGYTCKCPEGFVGDGYKNSTGCREPDGCTHLGLQCNAMAECHEDSKGRGFQCVCVSGYTGDGLNQNGCIPTSNCTSNSNLCVADASCQGGTCHCNSGFVGDGSSAGEGCTDVDECSMPSPPCVSNARCINKVGSFECHCLGGLKGNGFVNGSGCSAKAGRRISPAILGGIVAGATGLALVFGMWFVIKTHVRRRKARKGRPTAGKDLKKLREYMEACSESEAPIVFEYDEIEKATHSFASDRMLGGGAYGTVYAGMLNDGQKIAVKKLNQCTPQGYKQFVNEVRNLCSIHHRNLVRLLGCCLETGDPLVVYELVENGTLSQHLRQECGRVLSLEVRLRVGMETAQGLAYLHTCLSPPIYHRDVKSTNILLDHSFTAKLGDFGLSRLISGDATHVSTMAQGTPGYLDPEYYQTYSLSHKSDVYSFGVVLMELLTAQKPIDHHRDRREVSLASLAVAKISSGSLADIIDPALQWSKMDATQKTIIEKLGELAFRCLAFNREDRPTMAEVADELEEIRTILFLHQQQKEDQHDNETH